MAASAMNPLPCVIPSKYRRACSMARYAPAIPARAPLSNTPAYRRRYTLTPSVSAASGYSPTARSRSPNRVRLNTHWLTATSTTPVMIMGDTPVTSGRRAGRSRRRGISMGVNPRTPGDCVAFSKSKMLRKRANPPASRLSATPLMIWSTRNVIVTSAWISPNSRPAATAASTPASGARFGHVCAREGNRVSNAYAPTAPKNVPIIMMPSSPIFTTPPRSACTAPSDASRIGIVTRIAEARSATLNSEVMYSILQLSDSSTSCRLRRWCRGHRELCLALALGPHVPGQQLVRDHDGQDDERLQDDDNLFGHPGEELHPRRPAVQEAEQQRRRDHAQGIVLGQQGHGDPQEPEALGEVDIQVSKKAEDVVEPDQASDAGAEHEHSKLDARVGNAGRLCGQRVERHRPHLIAKPGAAEKVGQDHRDDDAHRQEEIEFLHIGPVQSQRGQQRAQGGHARRSRHQRGADARRSDLCGVAEDIVDQIQQQRGRDVIHHDRRDHFVRAPAQLQDNRDERPDHRAARGRQERQRQMKHGRQPSQAESDQCGTERPDVVLTFYADVEQADPE